MKQDEIIEMAKQIGLYGLKEGGLLPEFTAFAKLVAAKEREEASERAWKYLVSKGASWSVRQAVTDAIRGEA